MEFAELQALNRRPMHMANWLTKLDDFLKLSDREVLTHAGQVSHQAALDKARHEYERFSRDRAALPSPVDRHFEAATRDLKQLEAAQRTERSKAPTHATAAPPAKPEGRAPKKATRNSAKRGVKKSGKQKGEDE